MTTPRREDVIRALPYARRYARALTGSQPTGDALVAECLRDLLGNTAPVPDGAWDARHLLYWGVTRRFDESSASAGPADGLSTKHRQLMLLTSLEDVSAADAAPILGLSPEDANERLAEARERLRASAATDVLIIEDEPIIAMDLEELVQSCGHRVIGVAATEAEAIAIAKRARPGLILADINLGLGGDGTNAVSTILKSYYAPVIFVTAYPERLLTGDAVEPAFVITKPFEPMTLAIATYQAVTGGVQLDKV
jgi:CheY-like chemotaxis protein/DNA-directed RNA polymerase specialized sigma24 family protein